MDPNEDMSEMLGLLVRLTRNPSLKMLWEGTEVTQSLIDQLRVAVTKLRLTGGLHEELCLRVLQRVAEEEARLKPS